MEIGENEKRENNLKIPKNIPIQKEIGKIVYISEFNQKYLKYFYLILKMVYIVSGIGILFFLDYHIKYNDNSMEFNTYYLILVVGLYMSYLFIKEFFTSYTIKAIGDKGLAIVAYRFDIQKPKITQILFRNLKEIDINEGGGRVRFGEEKYKIYSFYENDKLVYKLKIYDTDKENNLFIEKVLEKLDVQTKNI